MDAQSRLSPCCCSIIYLYGRKCAVRIAGNITDDCELTRCGFGCLGDEHGGAGSREYTVKKDVVLKDLREWPAACGFWYIPFCCGHTKLRA